MLERAAWNKHSSLLLKVVTYGRKKFYNIGNRWKDPPVSPILYVRIFNLTNEEAFLTGKNLPWIWGTQ
jgi:hypothetical protein